MKLESIYIECKNFNKSTLFYEQLLNMKPIVFTKDRYVVFDCGNRICLYNPKYDNNIIKKTKDTSKNFNDEYLKNFKERFNEKKENNIIVLNFYADNLMLEYERLRKTNIKTISKIMYVNISEPYYYFTIKDPDGNEIEIYGNNKD